MFPPVLNTLSEGELVAGMHKYFCANLESATRTKDSPHYQQQQRANKTVAQQLWPRLGDWREMMMLVCGPHPPP